MRETAIDDQTKPNMITVNIVLHDIVDPKSGRRVRYFTLEELERICQRLRGVGAQDHTQLRVVRTRTNDLRIDASVGQNSET